MQVIENFFGLALTDFQLDDPSEVSQWFFHS